MKTQENLVSAYFPMTANCIGEHIQLINNTALIKRFRKDETILRGGKACSGLVAVISGQLRAFIQSSTGKQVTLYRLYDYDVCVMSASCLLKNMQFDIHLTAQMDTTVLIIPTATIELINPVNPIFRQYSLDLLAQRFSDVMWTMEQIAFSPMPARIARFIIDSANQNDGTAALLTHDTIAKELGSAREVITRILKYLQSEDMIHLSRGKILITDYTKLDELTKQLSE
ncbi:MAG: Crp/Fnr family transcriptional regulator [Erysipelotrichaceae bacterium]|nr:Crp/Fnr family transcriptional regulator [Erysipelotrichaceae bacterium]MDP3306217.1 Crp/Fnr family transcriptional regulator [Erysipelotrichaceae bacterium]